MTAYDDNQIIALFFGLFGSVAVVTALFVVPFVRRTVWLGWNNLQIWHLPLMILPDAMVLKAAPGCDTRAAWFDDRHLNGIDVPESESWAWSENDMKLVRAMAAGKVGVSVEDGVKNPSAVAPAGGDDPKEAAAGEGGAPKEGEPRETGDASKDAPAAAGAGAGAAAAGTTFQPILAYNAADHDKVGNWTRMVRDPSLSFQEKAKRTFVCLFFFGIDREIADFGLDEQHVADIHNVAVKYYGKTESVFRFLQFLTSSLACLAHGANDVGLSVGPIAILYGYWQGGPAKWQGTAISSTTVLDWMLAVAAVCLCLGFWFYGYNMMRVLGNRLTYHSPSRGFSMEMGSAITVLIAARNGIPVSTTNCIVGSTIGVGIASGGFKNVNWRLALFTLGTWLITVPTTAIVSGSLYAWGTFTPQLGCTKYSVALTFTNSTGAVVGAGAVVADGFNPKLAVTSNMLPQIVDSTTAVPGTVTSTSSLDKVLTFYSPGCSYVT